MKETVKLDTRHMPMLYKFLVEQSKFDQSLLDAKLRLLNDQDHVIVTCVNGSKIEQAFFVKIFDGTAMTHKIVGRCTESTVGILDMLCAVCSRNEPTILSHVFMIAQSDLYNFNECLLKSRLGRFMDSRLDNESGICITVKYPE